jgi:hypothetical protein
MSALQFVCAEAAEQRKSDAMAAGSLERVRFRDDRWGLLCMLISSVLFT